VLEFVFENFKNKPSKFSPLVAWLIVISPLYSMFVCLSYCRRSLTSDMWHLRKTLTYCLSVSNFT